MIWFSLDLRRSSANRWVSLRRLRRASSASLWRAAVPNWPLS